MIIAIDGPAGSGKSTIAQQVAGRLGLTYLDTGAMYRAVTLLAYEQGVSFEDDDALGSIALDLKLHFEEDPAGPPRVFVGDRDITEGIRGQLVTQKVSLVSAHPKVRHALTLRQRELAAEGDMVLEGRDTGTVVCPTAGLKVYLSASVEERARRRKNQLEEQGVCISLKTLERDLLLRDSYDSGRALAPLRKAKEALDLDTTTMSIEEVVAAIVSEAERRGQEDQERC